MSKYEYFRGLPEAGIVPRAPHAGPLLRHVYEQEHGRGGFAGMRFGVLDVADPYTGELSRRRRDALKQGRGGVMAGANAS